MEGSEEIKRHVEDLRARYTRVVDDGLWEVWPDLFTKTCLYKITTREKFDQRLPLAIMECRSREMLLDRIMGLRKINVYEPHRYLHQTGGLAVESIGSDTVKCRSNYLAERTRLGGSMSIFSAGAYLDKVRLYAEGAVWSCGAISENLLMVLSHEYN
jgi:3-phenylpropionate/cinnamic acid dioxygenase small subunit